MVLKNVPIIYKKEKTTRSFVVIVSPRINLVSMKISTQEKSKPKTNSIKSVIFRLYIFPRKKGCHVEIFPRKKATAYSIFPRKKRQVEIFFRRKNFLLPKHKRIFKKAKHSNSFYHMKKIISMLEKIFCFFTQTQTEIWTIDLPMWKNSAPYATSPSRHLFW